MRRITDQQRTRIEKRLTAALLLLYLAGKRKALTKLDRSLEAKLTPDQVRKVQQFAAKRAALIQSGTNSYLDNAKNDVPADATPEQWDQAELERVKKAQEYNASVLVPFLASRVAGWAVRDTYQEHGPDDQQWTLDPLDTAGCNDECDDAAAASPMSSEDAASYPDFPSHERCPHKMIPV